MTWRVELLPDAEKQFSKLDRPVQRRIAAFLRDRIATDENPRRLGDALEGPLSGFWRYPIGDYRLLCRIEDDRIVVVVVQFPTAPKRTAGGRRQSLSCTAPRSTLLAAGSDGLFLHP